MQIRIKTQVKLISSTYDVLKDTVGTIVRMDNEDSDYYTYEVSFNTGVVEHGVRHYHLEVVS